jgi:DMSO/TMAO reductase YedYZ molybdopterin-dependent catalytic subunit
MATENNGGAAEWASNRPKPLAVKINDDDDRLVFDVLFSPTMQMEGLITPTDLHYVVQHFGMPDPVRPEDWSLTLDGEVKSPLKLSYEELRRFPARTVRTVMECSGSDAGFFNYSQGQGPRPSRTNEGMLLSASEWTGASLAAVLNEAGLTGNSVAVRAEGWDRGVPADVTGEGRVVYYDSDPFYYDKGLPIEKALHPDTILAWAQNGDLLQHAHGAPVRLLVPGWSGNWSVKWLRKLEVTDRMPDCWYHYSFYYYGDSTDDPNKELITTIGVKSIVTYPQDDGVPTLPRGTHVLRGYAWSGAGAVSQVDVSVDGGETWQSARLEEPRDRFMWVRWSYVWDVQTPGAYSVMSRATDEVGRIQSGTPRYNNMQKNFSAIVANAVNIE